MMEKRGRRYIMMEERSRLSIGITALICTVSLIISVITMIVCLSMRADMPAAAENISSENADNTDITTGKPVSPIYYVGLHDEKIVVSTPDGDIVRELEAKAEFLPENEREMLKLGIAVYSSEQLYAVIENYME